MFGQPVRGVRVIDLHDDLAAALGHRYQVERELGHGGMAVVYLARDVKHSRRVAVKVLRPELASSVASARFLREIDVAARLVHPNILALHDSGAADGILYYVMPFVEGETLRARLDREHQLPIDDALAIARQVGAALEHAHAHDVVHRDVKPENILLTGDHVLVADFGLARALYSASTMRLTESAVAVGTPAYMSPEQAAADPEVDRRADIYSLACVLYEMVVGTPPFSGASAQAVLAQHLTAAPPSICAQRPHCPQAVDAAVKRALEKIPADRFRTVGEFMAALRPPAESDAPSTVAAAAGARPRIARGRAIATIGVAAATLLLGGLALRHRLASREPAVDPGRWVVLPFTNGDSGGADGALRRRVTEALDEWDGVDLVDERRVGDALAARRPARMTTDDVIDLARQLGAGRAVLGDLTRAGDSLTVVATLYDTRDGRPLRTRRITSASTGPSTQQLRQLASGLLRDRSELPRADAGSAARPSLAAWLAYDSARTVLERWDLAAAAAGLQRAVALDPRFPEGQLWLARVQLWSGQLDGWRAAARRAYDLRGGLAPYDSLAAEAQYALAAEHYPDACTDFSRMVALDSSGLAGWYGLGECQSRDTVILRDARSPSGYRFRGSVAAATRAYLRILDDQSPPRPAFVYRRLAGVLFTAGNQIRRGRLAGDTATFGAVPTLLADTLAFVPYPYAEIMSGTRGLSTRGKAAAIDRNRALLRRVYLDWTRDAPSSAEAHAALANLLEVTDEVTGDGRSAPSATAQIHQARALTRDTGATVALARSEIRLLVKRGDFGAAVTLADSLFARDAGALDNSLAGAAALTGRLHALVAILRAHASDVTSGPSGVALDAPPAILQDAAEALAHASLGSCAPLPALRARIERQLGSYVAEPARRNELRANLLRRQLALAAPCLGPAALAGIDAANNRVVMMEQALAAGRADSVRATFGRIAAQRAGERPGDVAPDYTYLESWLLAASGDTAQAIAHLDGSLEALPTLGVSILDFPSQSAGLVRAMILRADLAAATGDVATARRWAGAVSILWRNADPELQAVVHRMRTLAATTGR